MGRRKNNVVTFRAQLVGGKWQVLGDATQMSAPVEAPPPQVAQPVRAKSGIPTCSMSFVKFSDGKDGIVLVFSGPIRKSWAKTLYGGGFAFDKVSLKWKAYRNPQTEQLGTMVNNTFAGYHSKRGNAQPAVERPPAGDDGMVQSKVTF